MVTGMAVKTLSAVEIDSWSSNQHEFHGVVELKRLFGYSRQYFNPKCVFFDDSGVKTGFTRLTWYDARENHPTRSEYRLYYDSSFFSNLAEPGDTMILTVDDNMQVCIFVVARGTQVANCLVNALSNSIGNKYQIIENVSTINTVLGVLR